MRNQREIDFLVKHFMIYL